ncbi:hypothetical protein BJ875DRAFT_371891 [Amylocarpus encephaloides]|uniref:DNA ligase ATP-dependent N-terminal domain-containing protein n=1 Tax=Amylocarpus encephaloides TaxID=45428 RepID=A0A9P7YMK7_9HELO|nr:hypothetical protein BJ875DRAFT_371891 [Amylocarpus encephaloides]
MPFNFSYVCDLLDTLEKPYLRDAPYLPDHLRQYTQKETLKWFKRHKDRLNDNTTHHDAVMGMLRPESWSDRTYGWKPDTLEPLIARFLRLTRVQRAALNRWKTEPHTGDLGAQVGRIMNIMKEAQTVAIPYSNKVTIEILDTLFLKIASQNKGSSLQVHSLATVHQDQSPIDSLREIFTQLQPREAKWLTRLLLKNTGPFTVPTDFIVSSLQSQLQNCVKVHIALPASPVLKVGVTGMVKTTPTPKQVATPTLSCPTFQLSSGQKGKREGEAEIPTTSRTRTFRPTEYEYEYESPRDLRKMTSQTTNQADICFNIHTPSATNSSETRPPTAEPPSSERPLLESTSVVQRAGSGSCSLADSTCSLAACIFMIPSTLPAAIRTWIFTKLLPDHACRYITSVEHLAHSSLPHRCPLTNMKYRRIVLIEPKDTDNSSQLLQQVEDLKLTRSQGRKYWCEVFDWRLLEGVTKRESGIEGSGANPWKRYWMTAV